MDKTFEDPNNVFIYYDDMSYSGGQIYSFINQYTTGKLRKEIELHLGTYCFEHNKQMIRNRIATSKKQISNYENKDSNKKRYSRKLE